MVESDILKQWEETHQAFSLAFDTPANQLLVKGARAKEAREKIKAFNEQFVFLQSNEARQSQVLGEAIVNTAKKSGVYDGEVVMTVLHLSEILDKMSAALNAFQEGWVALADRLPPPYKNVAIGTPGKIKRIAWVHEDGRWETDQGGFTVVDETHWYEVVDELTTDITPTSA